MCYEGQATFGRNAQEGIKLTPYCSLPKLLPVVQIEAINIKTNQHKITKIPINWYVIQVIPMSQIWVQPVWWTSGCRMSTPLLPPAPLCPPATKDHCWSGLCHIWEPPSSTEWFLTTKSVRETLSQGGRAVTFEDMKIGFFNIPLLYFGSGVCIQLL